MNTPIALDIPHSLGKRGVRDRLDARLGKVADAVPGGSMVSRSWDGDTLNFSIRAMGQTVASALTVFEDRVHAVVDLPMFLLPFANMMKTAIEKEAPKLLK